ncbi:hypothetical protein ALQ26_06000, partial [Pseudomonas amygdali pv. lachrymans]
MPSNASS